MKSHRRMRYVILWICFTMLFIGAGLALEWMEGYKITTTEYYGLRNLGVAFLFLLWFSTIAAYLFTYFLINLIGSRWIRSDIIMLLIYTSVGAVYGIVVFDSWYSFGDGYFIDGYGLKTSTAVILYSIAGLLYGMLDRYWLSTKK